MANNAAERYIRAIRNKAKKQYAYAYLQWLRDGEDEDNRPDRGELSAMGAQAVRMMLREYTEVQR